MRNSGKPNHCGICNEGLFEEGPRGNPQRIGEVMMTATSAAEEMQGSDDQKREARRAFTLRVGLCPDCIDEHDLGKDGDNDLSNFYDQIPLSKVVAVPDNNPAP